MVYWGHSLLFEKPILEVSLCKSNSATVWKEEVEALAAHDGWHRGSCSTELVTNLDSLAFFTLRKARLLIIQLLLWLWNLEPTCASLYLPVTVFWLFAQIFASTSATVHQCLQAGPTLCLATPDAPSFQMTTNGVKDLYRPLYITCLLSQHLVWLNTDSSREQTCPMLLSFTAWLPLQSSDTKLIEQVHNTIRWLELLKALTVCLLTRVRACSVNPKDSLPCKTLGVDIKPPPVNLVCCVRRWHKMSGLFTVIEVVGVLFWDPVLHHTLPHALISPTSCTVDWKTVRNRVYAWNSLQAKSISHSVLYMLRQLFYLFLFLCHSLTNLGNTLLHVRYRGNNICWSLLGWYR